MSCKFLTATNMEKVAAIGTSFDMDFGGLADGIVASSRPMFNQAVDYTKNMGNKALDYASENPDETAAGLLGAGTILGAGAIGLGLTRGRGARNIAQLASRSSAPATQQAQQAGPITQTAGEYWNKAKDWARQF